MLRDPGSHRFGRVPLQKRERQEKSYQLRHNETRRINGTNPGEGIAQ